MKSMPVPELYLETLGIYKDSYYKTCFCHWYQQTLFKSCNKISILTVALSFSSRKRYKYIVGQNGTTCSLTADYGIAHSANKNIWIQFKIGIHKIIDLIYANYFAYRGKKVWGTILSRTLNWRNIPHFTEVDIWRYAIKKYIYIQTDSTI